MKKLSTFLLVVAVAIMNAGCDSNNNDTQSVSDLLADGWTLTSVQDSEGDQTAVFLAGFNSVDATFTQSGDFTIDVDSKVDTGDTSVSGTWSVNESQNRLTLTTTFSGIPINLQFTYTFNGDNEITLTADSATSQLLNALLGTTLQGTITITIVRD